MKFSMLRGAFLAAAFAMPQPAAGQFLKLIAWWNFDDVGLNAVDVQANIPAELRGGAAYTDAGMGRTGLGTDRAMSFGTGSQHLYVADASFLNHAATFDSISISFWQKLRTVRNQATLRASAHGQMMSTVPRGISAHTPWSDSTIYFDTGGCCDTEYQRIGGVPAAPVTWVDQWNHVLLVKDGDDKAVYINGVLGPSGQSLAPLPKNFAELFIGNSSNLDEAVDGLLDDFAFFAGAVTTAQIAQLAAGASPSSLTSPEDTDADGLPDAYERGFFPGDLTKLTLGGDLDADGILDQLELARGTNPTLADTDGDGLPDASETRTHTWVGATDTGTNPLIADTDRDGVVDGLENNSGVYLGPANPGTDPNITDTDIDGFNDGNEALYSNADPLDPTSTPLRDEALDLLAYWPFNEASNPGEVKDAIKGFVGKLRTGTDGFVSKYTNDAGGRSGSPGDRAIDFGSSPANATGIDVEAGEVLNIAASQNQVAFSFWQKLHSLTGSFSFKGFSPSSSGGERGASGHGSWSENIYYWDTAGCCTTAQRIAGRNPTPLNLTGGWHHFVYQKNGDQKQIWVDGILIVSGPNTSALPYDFRALAIGYDGGVENIGGLIDDFAIFADALAPEQVAQLAAGASPPSLVPASVDIDGDGMSNFYETAHGLNPTADDRALDLDADGSTNYAEFLNATSPNNPDTDGDGLKDGVETNSGTYLSSVDTGTNPLDTDSDGDGLSDSAENASGHYVSAVNAGTDPNKLDTDGDFWGDATEIGFRSDPFKASSIPASLNPARLDLLAWWPFNDSTNTAITTDVIHSIGATLVHGATYSGGAGGRTGAADDQALHLAPSTGTQTARVLNADWLNLATPADQLSISFWQYLAQVSTSSALWITSPSSNNGARGFQANTPWIDGTIVTG